MTYDYVTNAFISNGTGETIAAAEAAGSAPFQLQAVDGMSQERR